MSHPYPPPGQPDPQQPGPPASNQPGWPGQSGAQGQYPPAYPGSPVVEPGTYSQQPGAYGQPGTYGQQPGAYPPAGPGFGGQPGAYPQTSAYPAPPQKSSRNLIIGLAAVAVVLLLAVGGLGIALLVGGDDDPTPPVAGPTTTAPSGAPSTDPGPEESEPGPETNNAVTATYASDFEAVCEGGSIANAADYVPGSDVKAYAFSNSPDRQTNWTTRSMSSSDPYYARSAEFTKVSVVGCLSFVEGSEGPGKDCDYKDRDGDKVTVSYISSRFELVFYEAKTGKKLGDGGNINAPATRCPSFITYNTTTKKAYASPDTGAIQAAFTKFLS